VAARGELRAAGIELDPLARTATREGRRLDLSGKELAVLEALLTASSGALSAERLLEQAWDENTDPFTNTARVTIARLRRKLGEPNMIQNTPGIGYKIERRQTHTKAEPSLSGPHQEPGARP
jgi:DNA-binding response OmpR family regulator